MLSHGIGGENGGGEGGGEGGGGEGDGSTWCLRWLSVRRAWR